jgi:energy-coupling factor transport system permease protein
MKSFNPWAQFLYFALTTGVAMFTSDLLLIIISLSGGFLWGITVFGRGKRKFHLFALILFASLTIINPILSHKGETVLFVVNNTLITKESLVFGARNGLLAAALVYFFGIFSRLMTSDKILYLFGGISPRLALIISISLRHVPLLSDRAKSATAAQKTLGKYSETDIFSRIKSRLLVFDSVATWGLENGVITADSMAARGYGLGKRSNFSLFKFRTSDFIFMVFTIILFALSLFATTGDGFEYYPLFTHGVMTGYRYVGYISYGILALTPIILEGKETLKWKYLISRR